MIPVETEVSLCYMLRIPAGIHTVHYMPYAYLGISMIPLGVHCPIPISINAEMSLGCPCSVMHSLYHSASVMVLHIYYTTEHSWWKDMSMGKFLHCIFMILINQHLQRDAFWRGSKYYQPSCQRQAERHSGEWRLPSELPVRAWDIPEWECFAKLELTFVDQILAQND